MECTWPMNLITIMGIIGIVFFSIHWLSMNKRRGDQHEEDYMKTIFNEIIEYN